MLTDAIRSRPFKRRQGSRPATAAPLAPLTAFSLARDGQEAIKQRLDRQDDGQGEIGVPSTKQRCLLAKRNTRILC